MATAAQERIIFPLDVPSLADAEPWVDRLHRRVGLFKVGFELFAADGPDAVRRIQERSGSGVFADLKLHDIPMTVERAARVIRGLGVRMLTVHAAGGKNMLEAAVEGAGPDVCVLAVTRLTSQQAAPDEVSELARLARESGCGGVVCSGEEARVVREATGAGPLIVCPGVRPAGTDAGDQVRVVTPGRAIEAGADYLVIGRPIRDAADPVAAAGAIAEEIEAALA